MLHDTAWFALLPPVLKNKTLFLNKDLMNVDFGDLDGGTY